MLKRFEALAIPVFLVLSGPQVGHTGDINLESSRRAVHELAAFLEAARPERRDLEEESFAQVPLTKEDADRAQQLLWKDHAARIREERGAEMKAKSISLDGLTMRFDSRVFGKEPANGRALYISMHGGGGAPPAVNESQWKNQVRLGDAYRPKDCIYFVPRAPTDTWNLWHQKHIDVFFDRIIENLVVLEGIDPNKVFLMGYSAGGDGVYQLAPRMADRLAGACMMAGHPNESQPFGLRNLRFSIDVGENDDGYKRSEVAGKWGQKLEALRQGNPGAYEHRVNLRAGKGHWMELEDRESVWWVGESVRDPIPEEIVWFQDDVTHERCYWLALRQGEAKKGQHVEAVRSDQTVTIRKAENVSRLLVRFNGAMINLDAPLRVVGPDGRVVFEGMVARTIRILDRSLSERGDPEAVFSGEVEVGLDDRR